MSNNHEKIVAAVKQWIDEIIIGLNFCPFAKKVRLKDEIHFTVCDEQSVMKSLEFLAQQCQWLEQQVACDTAIVIFPFGFDDFDDYLDLVEYANALLSDLNYDGIFQLASFHPNYCFEGVAPNAAENYTNRAPYPILHIIRESSIERVLSTYPNPELIPERNINVANSKGIRYFEQKLQKYLSQ